MACCIAGWPLALFGRMPMLSPERSPLLLVGAQRIQVRHSVDLLRHILCRNVLCAERMAGRSVGSWLLQRALLRNCVAVDAQTLSAPRCQSPAPHTGWSPTNGHARFEQTPAARTPHQAAVAAAALWVCPGQQAVILVVVGCVQARHALGPAATGQESAARAASRWSGPTQTANSCRPAPTVTSLPVGCQRRQA